jgi:RNA polymerase sigma-70 factor (ECF subfamily)
VERAVFLLRQVFDYGYDEIAEIVGKSQANCRQITARARRHIESRKPRFEASRRRREELARRFFQAVGEGDTEGLIRLLAADVVAYADGGGKTRTFPRPVYGRERIARLLPGLETWLRLLGAEEMRLAEVNGQPGAVFLGRDGRAVLVVALDIADGLVQTIRAVSNPEKLRHLGPGAGGPWPLAR